MAVIVPIVSKFDDRGLKKAQSEFGKLGSSMKGLLGAAGLTVGLSGVVNVLKDSATAAIGDVKSQALLANQLRNTVGASDAQVAAVEASIKAMQMQAAVADDDIRPAFASLVRATGDVTQATSLTSLALDVAADTGNDLGAVSLALGKAVNGSTTSLLKLVPSIKGASNPMGELSKQFAGAAEEAANNDPIQRLTIVMGELQEQVGTYLLPTLEEFAGWLSDSSTQDSITWMIDQFGNWTKEMDLAADGVFYLSDQIDSFFKTISGSFEATPFTDFLGWISEKALAAFNPLQKLVNLLQQFGLLKKETEATGKGTKVSKGLTANEKYLLSQSLKAKPVDDPKTKPNTKDTQAAKAKAAADKARQAVIDAAKKAAEESKQAFEDLKAAVDDFNKSFALTADAFQTVFKFGAPLGEFEQQAVDAFQTMKDAAEQAFDNKLITSDALANLKSYAAREQALLQGIAKDRDVLAKKISIAQSVTAGVMGSLDINSMLSAETKTVSKSVTSIVNGIALTTTQSFDEVVTGGLAASFKKLVDKTKTFAGNLTKLKQLGLNGNLFKQIVEGGADAGGATAEAIIAGGADAVKELNGLFGELEKAGSDIAATSTPVMFALGEDITNSFIEGLRSEDQKLIDTATAMAALFTSQFKTQIGAAMNATLNVAAGNAGMVVNSGNEFVRQYSQANAMGTNSMNRPTVNVTINAGAITDKESLPFLVTNALLTANKQGLTSGLSRVLAL